MSDAPPAITQEEIQELTDEVCKCDAECAQFHSQHEQQHRDFAEEREFVDKELKKEKEIIKIFEECDREKDLEIRLILRRQQEVERNMALIRYGI